MPCQEAQGRGKVRRFEKTFWDKWKPGYDELAGRISLLL